MNSGKKIYFRRRNSEKNLIHYYLILKKMEPIKGIIQKVRDAQQTSLKTSYQNTLIRKEDSFETSIYTDELTKQNIAECGVRLQRAFPALSAGFFDVFSDRIKANNYTDQRLKDAIAHVIDNCIYPSPTIAQFISFDKRIKLYTYDDVLKLNDQMNGTAFQEYRPVRYADNPRPMYASLNDIKTYNLTPWENK